MPKSNEITLLETKDVALFLPVLREVDLGDRFLLSMLHWCGIGQRSTPLELWRVFLISANGEIAGVSGIYRQPGMQKTVCWLGWLGVRPKFRRQGYAKTAVQKLRKIARSEGATTLYVYTDADNTGAIAFYETLGFKNLGPAKTAAPGLTMAESDVVFVRELD
jgi:ribosomal protein S18 acetylase RimI-like enzyme